MSISTKEIIEFLTGVIEDRNRSVEDRERASVALKFYAEKIGEEIKPSGSAERDDIERHVAQCVGRMGAKMLWETPDDCMFQTVTEEDGIPRRHVLSRKYHDHSYKSVAVETPLPVPVFTPAVPLPVLAPSTEEQNAVKEMSLSFDERFSKQAVAARVAAIEKEAEVARRMRERTE